MERESPFADLPFTMSYEDNCMYPFFTTNTITTITNDETKVLWASPPERSPQTKTETHRFWGCCCYLDVWRWWCNATAAEQGYYITPKTKLGVAARKLEIHERTRLIIFFDPTRLVSCFLHSLPELKSVVNKIKGEFIVMDNVDVIIVNTVWGKSTLLWSIMILFFLK